MKDIVDKAKLFATAAHAAAGQRRKYIGDYYIDHPTAVVNLLKNNGIINDACLAAAWLHDVLEDTHVNEYMLEAEFGPTVSYYVYLLTDAETGNRKERKRLARIRISDATDNVKLIKLADLIDNSRSIVKFDPKFAKVFMSEMALIIDEYMESVKETSLYEKAASTVNKYLKNI